MKKLIGNLNFRVKVAEEANNPVILTVDEAKQIINFCERSDAIHKKMINFINLHTPNNN